MAGFLIDANLPRRFALWSGPEYSFVHDLGATWKDTQIWAYAAQNALTIVSKDADFSSLAILQPTGPKVVHVRVGNLTINELHRLLTANWPAVCSAVQTCRLVQIYTDRIETIT